MKVFLSGNVLDVVSKEYEFEGRKGISNKVVIYSEGSLYHVKIKAGEINYYKELIGQAVELECNIFINGKCSLSVA